MNTKDRSMVWMTRGAALLALLTAIGLPLATNRPGDQAPSAATPPHSWIAANFPVGQAGFARGTAATATH